MKYQITQGCVAEVVFISRKTIFNWELGKTNIDILIRL